MSTSGTGSGAPDIIKTWPSVDQAKPSEEGGPIARTGFNYQDEIAVGFLIDMLSSPTLSKIHCETHDDIVLVCQTDGCANRTAEYVQVKASEQDKLWSVADICQRKKSKVGTSIFETSLGRDEHIETSRFRLVTLRPVVSALKPLTYDLDSKSRAASTEEMKALLADLDARFPSIVSPKSNGASFWLENCRWDERHSEIAVRRDNSLRLIKLAHAEGSPLLMEQAELLLDELRSKAKAAGDAKWDPDPKRKIITRVALRAWWEGRTQEVVEGSAAKSGGKLAAKMDEAGLADDLIRLAIEMRRDYAAESRTPRYLEADDAERLRRRVRSELSSLSARFVAGQLRLDPLSFHAFCLDRMDTINAERAPTSEDQSAFLKGCMYDITDRCLFRFARRA